MILARVFTSLLSITLLAAASARAQTPADDEAVDRALRHATPEWQALAAHMPDAATAAPGALELAGDVLRARRMPEDALDYYHYALQRGGDEARLQNDIGVTLLGLQRYDEARVAFRRALKLQPKGARTWNNLGAAEYVSGNVKAALTDYQRAVKLDKREAVFHANLGTAYFEVKNYEDARDQLDKAVKLDRNIFHSGGWAGVQAHVLSASDHGRFCYEMAKMSARQHEDEDTIRWLGRSVEAGFDIMAEMSGDKDFELYRKDNRVLTLVRNAKAMRQHGQIADSGLAPPPPAE
jgi:tetratricopeptide (TPR) repeat protein